MGMLLMCSRGCGHPIMVTSEMIEEATSKGTAINVQHEVCPGELGSVLKTYNLAITISEVKDGPEPELLSSLGATVEAGSFKLALPKLQEALNKQWVTIVGMADIVDTPTAPDDAPDDAPDQP